MIRPWMIWAVLIAALCGFTAWLGWSACDAQWTQRDTDRQLADTKASKQLSEQYRIKESKLNDYIGTIETKAINDAAASEMEYRDVLERLRNASTRPADGLRVKSALTCRSVSNTSATTSDGNEEIQAGLSAEVAGSAIRTGAECDQIVVSLNACQQYVETLHKEKPLN